MNYNLYIKKTELNNLKQKYSDSIEKLNQLYFDLENTVNNIKEQSIWEGESFNLFIDKFNKWKLDYLKSINRLIILKNFIEDILATADTLIEERDNLL